MRMIVLESNHAVSIPKNSIKRSGDDRVLKLTCWQSVTWSSVEVLFVFNDLGASEEMTAVELWRM